MPHIAPLTLPRYVNHLNEVSKVTSIDHLTPIFDALNSIHRSGEFEPPAVEPTTRQAYLAATKRVALSRLPPERAAPIAPRFVYKMLELAIQARACGRPLHELAERERAPHTALRASSSSSSSTSSSSSSFPGHLT